ncbi:hypothetical protein SSPIM334S_02524 [Streptomyces spiroverticillatus]|nr:hypothetical protein [Streptomyces finlayi]
MSRRIDARRGRAARRDAARDERRARLHVLLARADRGVLTPEDCAALRLGVEAEIAESNTHRRSAGGQQAAATRLHARVEAAEQAIVETEQRAETAEQLLDALCSTRTYRDLLAEQLAERHGPLVDEYPPAFHRLLDHVAEQLAPRAQQ